LSQQKKEMGISPFAILKITIFLAVVAKKIPSSFADSCSLSLHEVQ